MAKAMNQPARARSVLAAMLIASLAAATAGSPGVQAAQGQWQQLVQRPSARFGAALAAAGGDQAVLFGGLVQNDELVFLSDTWIYDLGQGTWREDKSGAAPSARAGHAMAFVSSGKVLLFGGWSGGQPLDDTWVYDLSTGNWTLQSPEGSPPRRLLHAMVYIGEDQVLLFGGLNEPPTGEDGDDLARGDMWLYDLSADEWSDLSENVPAELEPRGGHGMALLDGDSVLLFGGVGNEYLLLADTWLYDVSAQSWTEDTSGQAPPPRAGHAMAALGAGQALLFGGRGENDTTLADTWRYASGDWTQLDTGHDPAARWIPAAAAVGEGTVLMFGGQGEKPGPEEDEPALGDAWLFDRLDADWSDEALRLWPSPRASPAMVYAGSSRVLLFGGKDRADRVLGDTWLFNTTSNRWMPQTPDPSPLARYSNAMAPIGDGKVLLFGGAYEEGENGNLVALGDTWLYDLATRTWTNMAPAGDTPAARYLHAMAYLGGDQVLLFGGSDDESVETGSYLGDTWRYDLSENTWTEVFPGSSPGVRCGHAMAPLPDGQVLLFGGMEAWQEMLQDTWLYEDGDWTVLTPDASPAPRGAAGLVAIEPGQLLLFGGIGGEAGGWNSLGDSWLFTADGDGDWEELNPSPSPPPRFVPAMADLGGNGALLFGGSSEDEEPGDRQLGDLWRYDATAGGWSGVRQGNSPKARAGHGMAYLTGEQVLLFGGVFGEAFDPDEEPREVFDDTWLYDRAANTWTQLFAAVAPRERFFSAMAHAGGGRALLFGGFNWRMDTMGDTWLFDLGAGTWARLTPDPSPPARAAHALAYLGDERVLLFGGWSQEEGGHLLADTWVYDAEDGTWESMTPATSPPARSFHAMAYIGTGKVLLFGGQGESGYLADTWIYDLEEDTWTQDATGPSPTARIMHAMTYLGGDRVLLVAGQAPDESPLGDVWVYDLSTGAWEQVSSSPAPQARVAPAMADIGSWRVNGLLFGGAGPELDSWPDDTWQYGPLGNDAVQLAGFTARRQARTVILEWQTISEINHAGFRLLREEPSGRLVNLTPQLIAPAAAGGELDGACYAFVDRAAPAAATRYWLEDVDRRGRVSRHGPALAPAFGGLRPTLPVLPAGQGAGGFEGQAPRLGLSPAHQAGRE